MVTFGPDPGAVPEMQWKWAREARRKGTERRTPPAVHSTARPAAVVAVGFPRRMRIAVVVAIATVVALVAVLAVVLLRDSGSEPGATPPSPSTTPSATASTTPTPGTPSSTPTTSPTPTPTVRAFAYQPLWPFTSSAQAAAWQRSYRSGGHQPWHLDAGQTALSFTTGFLGFTEIDKVIARSIKADDARISVGYKSSEGPASIAAVIHLVRIGQGSDAPWEVVGTADTTLTLERPRYGATASSPITVGGRITGVDESIRIDVRQAGSDKPLGSSCCVSAGGENQAWSTRVTFRGPKDNGPLTIVASTAGHVRTVERFALTAIRPR